MKRFFYALPCILLALFCTVDTAVAQVTKQKLSRVRKNADGSVTELERTSDTLVTKRNLIEKANGERVTRSRTIYVIDRKGRPRSCIIYDGQGTELFRVRYGYLKTTGQLIAEDMFDSKVNTTDPKTGKRIPVQRLYYKYDAQGRRSKPFAFNYKKGKKVEEVFSGHIKERLEKIGGLSEKGGTHEDNPFR